MIFHWDIPQAFLKVSKTFLNIIFSWLPLSLAYWNLSYHYPLMLFSFFNCLFLGWKVMYSDLPEFCVHLAFPLDFPGIVKPTSREVFKDDIPDEIPFYILCYHSPVLETDSHVSKPEADWPQMWLNSWKEMWCHHYLFLEFCAFFRKPPECASISSYNSMLINHI